MTGLTGKAVDREKGAIAENRCGGCLIPLVTYCTLDGCRLWA